MQVSKRTTLHVVNTATMTIIDLISNVGGTLGLFLGFSVLSIVEIVYWSGRSICKRRRRRNKLAAMESCIRT